MAAPRDTPDPARGPRSPHGMLAGVPRIKGVSLIEVVKVLRANRDAALGLLHSKLHPYLHDRLLASQWYPEEDYLVLLEAAGKIMEPLLTMDVWEFMGEQGAHKDFTGLYASVVRKGDPWGTLRHAGKIWSMYRDTGRLSVERQSETLAHLALHDYVNAGSMVCGTLTGYYRELLRLSGASHVRVKMTVLRAYGEGPTEWTAAFE